MTAAAVAVASGVAVAVALVLGVAAAWAATKAIRRRERTREHYRAAVAESLSVSLASPTRIARGLTKVELNGVAPVDVVRDDRHNLPHPRRHSRYSSQTGIDPPAAAVHSQGKHVYDDDDVDDDDGEFDSFYTAQDSSSYPLQLMKPFSKGPVPRTTSSTTGSTTDTAASCVGVGTSVSSEEDSSYDEEDGESVASPHHHPRRRSRPHDARLSSSTSSSTSPACPVCLDDILPGQRRRTIRACGHTFHSRCLRVWLRRDDTCPLCRVRLASAPPALDGIEVIQRHQLALRRASTSVAIPPSNHVPRSSSLSRPLSRTSRGDHRAQPASAPARASTGGLPFFLHHRGSNAAAEPPQHQQQPPPTSPLSSPRSFGARPPLAVPSLVARTPADERAMAWPDWESPVSDSGRLAQMIASGVGYESSLEHRARDAGSPQASSRGSADDVFLDVSAPLRRQSTLGSIRGALRRITSAAPEKAREKQVAEEDVTPSASGGSLIVHVGADLCYDERV